MPSPHTEPPWPMLLAVFCCSLHCRPCGKHGSCFCHPWDVVEEYGLNAPLKFWCTDAMHIFSASVVLLQIQCFVFLPWHHLRCSRFRDGHHPMSLFVVVGLLQKLSTAAATAAACTEFGSLPFWLLLPMLLPVQHVLPLTGTIVSQATATSASETGKVTFNVATAPSC